MSTTACCRLRRVAALTVLGALAFATACSSGPPQVVGGPESTSVVQRSAPIATSRTLPSLGTSSTTQPTPGDPGQLPAACELITERDAAEVFDEPAVAGEQRRDECWWSTANDLKTVNVIRRTGDIDAWRRGYSNDSWTKIDMGDEGYTSKVLDSNVFRIGDTTYEINVVYSTSKGDPGRAVTILADRVFSRL